MEENKEGMNTEQAGNSGMLYGIEPQPQEEGSQTSAVYGTNIQPSVPESVQPQPVPVQLSKAPAPEVQTNQQPVVPETAVPPIQPAAP